MKRAALLLLILVSCNHEDLEDFTKVKESEFTKFASFSSFEEFDSVSIYLASREYREVKEWQNKLGITSLRSILEGSIEAEELFLTEFEGIHNQELTRDQIGWSKVTNNFLEKGFLFVDQYGLQDANVTIPRYANVVNPYGIVRIGSVLYQFKRDEVISVLNENNGKDDDLINLKSLPGFLKSEVQRAIVETDGNAQRSMLEPPPKNSKCESVKDNYRLIAYEEYISTTILGNPCTIVFRDYYLRLRSLRRILGTWQNHNTGALGSSGSYRVVHFLGCPTNNEYPTLRTIEEQGYDKVCPFGNTCELYFFNDYPNGICTTSACVPTDPDQYDNMFWYERRHYARGKNGTNCYVGQ